MSTFHALVWMDHSQAHVLMFDTEHVEAQRIKSRSHHKHPGKSEDHTAFFQTIAQALQGTHEVLLTGPGAARTEFRKWCDQHSASIAHTIVDSVAADHPTDHQLVAMAKQYFKRFDAMGTAPSQS